MFGKSVFTLAVVVVTIFAASSVAVSQQPHEGVLLASKAIRAAANKVAPSVVRIETFGGAGRGQQPASTGLVVAKDGYIVTSTFNLREKPAIITVVFQDGKRRVAKLLGRDDGRGICMLKVDGADDLPVPDMAPRSEIRVGQWAIAVGSALRGAPPVVAAGIISATSRISGRAVQTDASISPFNYGGPLLDIDGRVIGVCAPLAPGNQDPEAGARWYDSGIGFAVPLHGADHLLAALKAGKTIKPGFLGVEMSDEEHETGVIIKEVKPNTPAETAGLKPGDVIVSIAEIQTSTPDRVRIAIGRHIAGDEVEINIIRDGNAQTLKATLEAAPNAKPDLPPESLPQP